VHPNRVGGFILSGAKDLLVQFLTVPDPIESIAPQCHASILKSEIENPK
jgi:hypothetical protein